MVDSGTLSQLFWQREESIVASDCESIWSCDAEGLLEEELIDGCVTDATCVVEDNGLFGCQCDEGFTGSGTDSCEEDVNECHYVLAQNGSPVVIDVSIYIYHNLTWSLLKLTLSGFLVQLFQNLLRYW